MKKTHFKTVIKHKKEVFKGCCELGIPVQGLIHDLSKFSPTEFGEGKKFYVGTSSPIDEAKRVQGYSAAWLHHKGRNKHHWEYWTDWEDRNGAKPIARKIPFKYCLESLADYIGAGKAYEGKAWTRIAPLRRWIKFNEKYLYHHETRILMTLLMKGYSNNTLTKERLTYLKERYEAGKLKSAVILYGSFNPITPAHAQLLKMAKDKVGADDAFFECVGDIYKVVKPHLAHYVQRTDMVKCFFMDHPEYKGELHLGYNTCYIEEHMKFYDLGKSYEEDYDLVFILMGDDNIAAMDRYFTDPAQKLDKLFNEFIPIVGTRECGTLQEALNKTEYLKEWSGAMYEIHLDSPLSSTLVRKELSDFGYCREIGEMENDYVRKHGLYTCNSSSV